MRILVFGATGPSGICLVHEIQRAHPDATIVIYARSPQKLPADISSSPNVTIIQGQLDDKAKLATAFSEIVDVVLSALGAMAGQPKTLPITTAYANIISLMQQHNVKRLIALSTISYHDARDSFASLSWSAVTFIKWTASSAYDDVRSYTRLISESDLDWTCVRVPILSSRKGDHPIAGYVGDGKVGSFLSRGAFAEFVVKEMDSNEWVRKAPAISS